MRKLLLMLPLFLIALTLSSCLAKKVTLHPVTEQDIRCDDKGCWMSHAYIEKVMKVKLEAKGL